MSDGVNALLALDLITLMNNKMLLVLPNDSLLGLFSMLFFG